MEPAADNLLRRGRKKVGDGFRWARRRLERPFGWARRVAGRTWASTKVWRTAALFALAGVVAIGLSLLPGAGIDDGWTRDLLMTIGSSLALFAPFYVITRSLDGHLAEVTTETRKVAEGVAEVRTAAAATTAALTESVDALRADVDRKLSDFAQGVTEQLQAEAEADSAAFDSLRRDEPTRATVLEALGRANDLGLTTVSRPPRVDVSDRKALYVSGQFDPDFFADAQFVFRVEDTAGTVIDRIEWHEDQSAKAVFVEVGRAVRKQTGEAFDSVRLLTGLADLLDAAATQPERRPAIELCDPQWMVCDDQVVSSGRDGRALPYGLSVDQIRPPSDVTFVTDKTWVDFDSFDRARAIALELFPDTDRVWNVFDRTKEPPL